jgi:hypothetical protein
LGASSDPTLEYFFFQEGLNKERISTVSSLRNEQGRQKLSDRETVEQAKQVKPVGTVQSAEPFPTRDNGKSDVRTWEAVFERENMQNALKRVESNKGAAGVDGMKVEDLYGYLKAHWQEMRETLESGKYRPSPVRRVEIPKPDGGVRQLGIPIWRSHCTSYSRVGYLAIKKTTG